jgi:hypothetical protein
MMSAHLPSIHAPRWLREAGRSGHRGHRASATRSRRAPGAPVLPVAIVVIASLVAGAIRAVGTDVPEHLTAAEASLTVPALLDVGPQGMVQPASFVAWPVAAAEAGSSS